MPMSTKRKAPVRLAAPVVKANAKRPVKATIDETRTSVSGTDALQRPQVETLEISSDPDSDEDISDDGDDHNNEEAEQRNEGAEALKLRKSLAQVNSEPQPQKDEGNDADSDAEATSPSFGELLRGNEAIDATAMLQKTAAEANAVARTARNTVAPLSHQSLGTVLSQALQTDDTDLLESCLHATDVVTIQNTIELIDSSLAGILLNKLAARLHWRPGRADILLTWVQWTLIAHGGALASQPKVISSLISLQKVLAERSKGLISLLALKGKLDILEGQMELRQKMKMRSGLIQQGDDEADEADVIYVEGEDNEHQEDAADGVRSRRRYGGVDANDEDYAIVANGVTGDSEDEGENSDEDSEDSNGVEEPLDEVKIDYDEVDESIGEDEESDVEAAPPSKLQKVMRVFGRKK